MVKVDLAIGSPYIQRTSAHHRTARVSISNRRNANEPSNLLRARRWDNSIGIMRAEMERERSMVEKKKFNSSRKFAVETHEDVRASDEHNKLICIKCSPLLAQPFHDCLISSIRL